MSTPGVSLSRHGLRAPEGLDCPAGGYHHVLEAELVLAKVHGEGYPICRNCGQPVPLVAVDQDP